MVAILVDGTPRKTKLLVIWRWRRIFALCQLSMIDKLRSAVAEETSGIIWAYQKQERPSLFTKRKNKPAQCHILKLDLIAHFPLKCYTVWVLQHVYRAKDIFFYKGTQSPSCSRHCRTTNVYLTGLCIPKRRPISLHKAWSFKCPRWRKRVPFFDICQAVDRDWHKCLQYEINYTYSIICLLRILSIPKFALIRINSLITTKFSISYINCKSCIPNLVHSKFRTKKNLGLYTEAKIVVISHLKLVQTPLRWLCKTGMFDNSFSQICPSKHFQILVRINLNYTNQVLYTSFTSVCAGSSVG